MISGDLERCTDLSREQCRIDDERLLMPIDGEPTLTQYSLILTLTLVSSDRLVHPTLYEPTSARWARTPLSPLRVCGPTQKNRWDRDLAVIRQ